MTTTTQSTWPASLPPPPPGVKVDCSYLNRTVNKDPQAADTEQVAGLWHETESPNPRKPQGTLNYNLAQGPQRGKRGSYNLFIAGDGTLYLYLDWTKWIAWSAGNSAALGYTDEAVSAHTIGIEVDSRGDGTPPTPAQWTTMIAVARWLRDQLGIPLDAAHHLAHKDIALPPGRKTDPAGYTIADLLHRVLAAG